MVLFASAGANLSNSRPAARRHQSVNRIPAREIYGHGSILDGKQKRQSRTESKCRPGSRH